MRYSLAQLLRDGVIRYQTEFKINQPVTIDNALADLEIETHVEVFEDVLAKTLINAWEAYGNRPIEQRPIAIRTRRVDLPGGTPAVEIRVEDQGNGIDPEIRDHMFEPFISSKQTVGVGMGLTVARHALRNMGGEVSMADRIGGGAVAILVHPIEKKRRASETED